MIDIFYHLSEMNWVEGLLVFFLSSCIAVFVAGVMGCGDDFHE